MSWDWWQVLTSTRGNDVSLGMNNGRNYITAWPVAGRISFSSAVDDNVNIANKSRLLDFDFESLCCLIKRRNVFYDHSDYKLTEFETGCWC